MDIEDNKDYGLDRYGYDAWSGLVDYLKAWRKRTLNSQEVEEIFEFAELIIGQLRKLWRIWKRQIGLKLNKT